MPGQLVALLAALGLASGAAATAGELAAGLRACRDVASDAARLACYDALPGGRPVVEFTGSGSGITPPFAITRPSELRFESRDAILVLYLLDAAGEVVQNLHRGGAGEGTYLIERPGRYSLQVNASGGWRLTVAEP